MPQDPNRLIWIDLEMTGLKPDTDRILEVARDDEPDRLVGGRASLCQLPSCGLPSSRRFESFEC